MKKVKECENCEGKGYITIKNEKPTFNDWLRYRREICTVCKGKGKITEEI